MAKGQMRSNKEKKKPKAAWNADKKKGGQHPGPGASPFAPGQGQNPPGHNPYGKKS